MTHTADVQTRNYYSLGLLLLAVLPWLGVAPIVPVLLCALLAWGSRQIRGARQYAIYSSVYAATVVFFLPPFDLANALFNRLEPFFIVLVLGYLLGAALDGIQDSTFWAWFAPLLLFLALPTAWGAAAVLGLALLAALEKQQGVVGSRLYRLERQHILVLTGLIACIAAIGFVLPQVASLQDPTQTMTPPPPKPVNRSEKPPEVVTSGAKKAVAIGGLDRPSESLIANTTALMFVIVVVLAVFLFHARLEKRKNNPQNSLWDLMPIVAVLVLAIVILAFALNAPPNIPDGMEQPIDFSSISRSEQSDSTAINPSDPTKTQDPNRSMLGWFPFAMAALALILLYWLLRRASRQLLLSPEPRLPVANPVPTQAASNRVRQAYLRFLESATRQGMPRMAAETPLEFVGRYAEQFPQARAAAQTLTDLYEPVRYGQLAAETHALQAENALEKIQQQT
jgi:cytochrome bd-type quinol oxidase subunit 2